MFNDTIRYNDNKLVVGGVPLAEIAQAVGTPTYVYSLDRARHNYHTIQAAFSTAHIHYSAKANGNLAVLHALIQAGAGIDAVSAGEIFRARTAGAKANDIVFAGVGKTPTELRYAVEQGVGWINIENTAECDTLETIASETGRKIRVALRYNPDVTANTHPYIATGHGGAKFGLTADAIRVILAKRYHHLDFAGIHIHIGSQLHDTDATVAAINAALELIAPYPHIHSVNIGGGLPVAYTTDEHIPDLQTFADAVLPLLKDYQLLLEPGRSIIADAGVLITEILYVKRQAGQTFYIVDASMTELIRPALYQAQHLILPICERDEEQQTVTVVGPVCETTDVLASNIVLPDMQPGDRLAILTAGAYGMVMSSTYNARPRPPEVVVDGSSWRISRPRETWDDLIRGESI
jgi:diaminopimelate decarboxylase